MASNIRAIPNLLDGLKPGQIKILWSCFKRNLINEIKVAQLGGYVSEHAAYHHGEISLFNTIINMAQDYVGSNNINLLLPNGQFGTRHAGGKDSASPRYIFTKLNKLTRLLYPIIDDQLLKYKNDDGLIVEPEYYIPILPMLLINGTNGVGTGFSTNIPSYNPLDLIKLIENSLEKNLQLKSQQPNKSNNNFNPSQFYLDQNENAHQKAHQNLIPYYHGYNGIIKYNSLQNSFISYGSIQIKNSQQIIINELPIYKWTENYKEYLIKKKK